MAVELRLTVAEQLSALLAMEAQPDTAPFIIHWSHERHARAIESTDEAHLTVVDDGHVTGFVLLAGLTNEHHSIELRRIVVEPREPWLAPDPVDRHPPPANDLGRRRDATEKGVASASAPRPRSPR